MALEMPNEQWVGRYSQTNIAKLPNQVNNGPSWSHLAQGPHIFFKSLSMTQRGILRRIIATTSQFILEIPALPSYHVQNIPLPPIPRLRLQRFIAHFHSEMRRTGFLPQICTIASAKATELAQYYQKSYESACQDTLKTPRKEEITKVIESLRSTYEALYEKRDLPRFLDDASKLQDTYFNNCNQHLSSKCSKGRPMFNQVSYFFRLSKIWTSKMTVTAGVHTTSREVFRTQCLSLYPRTAGFSSKIHDDISTNWSLGMYKFKIMEINIWSWSSFRTIAIVLRKKE